MRSTSLGLLLSLGLVSASGAAMAQDRAAEMPMGAAILPPIGFLAFCESQPNECLRQGASPQAMANIRTWAGQARWTRTFAEAGIDLGPQGGPQLIPRTPSASTSIEVGATISEARAAAKLAAQKAAAKPRPKAAGAVPKPKPTEEGASATVAPTAPIEAAEASVRLAVHGDLEAVNRRINRAIRRSTDEATYGQADVWAIPQGPRARGDCEDYALAKRRALIEMGISPEDLSLAIVRTRAGEIHAVLLAQTEQGEFVLDNLSPWVVRWDVAPYEWLERQVRGSAVNWVRLDVGRT